MSLTLGLNGNTSDLASIRMSLHTSNRKQLITMGLYARIMNVALNRVESRSRLDAARTLFAKLGIFFPVSKRRWVIAQVFESVHYKDVINNLPVSESKTLLRHYSGPGAQYFKDTIEHTLDLDLFLYFRDKILIEVACGASSVFLNIQSPLTKIGIDPMKFSEWVIAHYDEMGAKILTMSGEDFQLKNNLASIEDVNRGHFEKVVIFTNALQHFRSLDDFFSNLQNQLGTHELLFLEFLNIPADRAHPQILTEKRLNYYLRKYQYRISHSATISSKLPGFIEQGNGLDIEMYVVHARSISK